MYRYYAEVIVDKAVAVWEAANENPGYAEVVEEMTKRTTAGGAVACTVQLLHSELDP